jgi:DNA topoisomerase-1
MTCPWYASARLAFHSDHLQSKRRRTATKGDEDDSDVPLSKKTKLKKPPKLSAFQIGGKDKPKAALEKDLVKKKAKIENAAKKEAKAKRKAIKDESDSDVPLSKASKSVNGVKSSAKTNGASPTKTKSKAKSEDDEDAEDGEEEYRWWEDPNKGDGTIKWTTLEHNGVVFPPPYEPLPAKVKLHYDGVPVSLHVDAEEVATFYGSMLNSTVNVSNPVFNKNFFDDFKKILDKTGHGKDASGRTVKILEFERCDFSHIFEHFDSERAKKKAMPAAQKKALKAAKDAAEELYMFCLWDGRKQKVGNFRVEPPGLFRGRGEHPKTGKVKLRVHPNQITINIGRGVKPPAPPPGTNWKEIKHDQEATWLAMWQENINGAYKYVMLAANSDIKGQSDHKKFEKARELKKYIDKIRSDYNRDLKSKIMADRQRATAVYLIDKLALRAGNEKGEDEADTVGCCSLKFEHVTLKEPDIVVFDFLGKDSIRYYDEVKVDVQVFKNLKIFKKSPKKEGDEIFDRLTTSALNKHLSTYMAGLTAKVFRTYNASWTMAKLLGDLNPVKMKGTSVHELIKIFNDANREVAILCNHKRTVTANHETQMNKMNEKINGLRYQQWRLRMMMLDLDPKLKKKRDAGYFDRPEDLTDEWVRGHQKAEVEDKRQKIRKKFEKDNEKLVADGKKPLSERELKDKLAEADELDKKFRKENSSGKVAAEGKGPTVEKFEASYDKLEERIRNMRLQAEDKEENKEVALGTSKIVSFTHCQSRANRDRTTSIPA